MKFTRNFTRSSTTISNSDDSSDEQSLGGPSNPSLSHISTGSSLGDAGVGKHAVGAGGNADAEDAVDTTTTRTHRRGPSEIFEEAERFEQVIEEEDKAEAHARGEAVHEHEHESPKKKWTLPSLPSLPTISLQKKRTSSSGAANGGGSVDHHGRPEAFNDKSQYQFATTTFSDPDLPSTTMDSVEGKEAPGGKCTHDVTGIEVDSHMHPLYRPVINNGI